jgi:3-deoxy-D-manno-octulosonate 8-phosphate phosphatase (KDO 8-P phosphatase)
LNLEIKAKAERIKLLLMDVDGVLTDGRLYHLPVYAPDGTMRMAESKGFDSQDGIALQWCAKLGIKTGVISGRLSEATAERARQAKMTYVYQGHTEKIPILETILRDANLPPEHVAYIGDDLTDIVIMKRVGFRVAVANARPEVKRAADYITTAVGGSGAVRETIELMLEAKGEWASILKHYEAD